MKILIDADGCPVVNQAVAIAKRQGVECLILCDTSHIIEMEGIKTITVSKGADSVDFVLVNMAQKGDIVVTQDYGLAAMCLARLAIPVDQNGMEYTQQNIDSLLFARHIAKKIRSAGGRLKGPSKRNKEQDKTFVEKFTDLVLRHKKDESQG